MSLLSLIGDALAELNIEFTSCTFPIIYSCQTIQDFLADTGAMSSAERQMALKRISQDTQCKIILISIKAGGTGRFSVEIIDLPALMVKQGWISRLVTMLLLWIPGGTLTLRWGSFTFTPPNHMKGAFVPAGASHLTCSSHRTVKGCARVPNIGKEHYWRTDRWGNSFLLINMSFWLETHWLDSEREAGDHWSVP